MNKSVRKFVRQASLDEKVKKTKFKRVDDRIAKESSIKYPISQIASVFRHIKEESLKSNISVQELLASYGLNGPLYYCRVDLLKIEVELKLEHDREMKLWRIEDARRRHDIYEKLKGVREKTKTEMNINKHGKEGLLNLNGASSRDILMKYGFLGPLLMSDRSFCSYLGTTGRLTVLLKDSGKVEYKKDESGLTRFDWRQALDYIDSFIKPTEKEKLVNERNRETMIEEAERTRMIARRKYDRRNEDRKNRRDFKNRLGL